MSNLDLTRSDSSLSILEDSSPSSGPFEGPEKLLELWFSSSSSNVPQQSCAGTQAGAFDEAGSDLSEFCGGLRKVQKSVWYEMLDEVKCKVLSVIKSKDVDAYLLSESSMFVWPHKIILKTCGTTTLLLGLPTLIRIAQSLCGFSGVWRCFYSRKTFMFPERQSGPHKDWNQEVQFLDGIFENGSAYTVGKMNGDHWLLYLTPPKLDVLLPSPAISQASAGPISNLTLSCPNEPDSTLEILMSGLSTKACGQFYTSNSIILTRYPEMPSIEGHGPGLALAEAIGLSAESLIGGGITDAFLFSPCGFSLNAIGGKDNSRYATIHVTPEPEYSYASFECNVDYSSKHDELVQVVKRVVGVFEPARMSITLFVSHDSKPSLGGVKTSPQSNIDFQKILGDEPVKGYKLTDQIIYKFEGYDLVFVTFERV
ncbi:S-adenosylmethionine decarboxylase [Phakopsora pachyrhizi]|uniref:adenosylmethionine decarboxylase n=1 Tax=Phakopsora pachyrhizi TaxID=170000 RepID=A0AAV0AT53_PHAPC|nr:S-adenosylmethionine decarboxylase [Phakopsora pachyrhizi]KAI8451922.1 S-adenosylmethionine decarboxylase [Phakopsora pachyrhizi]CAH7671750.1 S-adenosylmethionine decarboxylase [Phakopsora pachyrhizi]